MYLKSSQEKSDVLLFHINQAAFPPIPVSCSLKGPRFFSSPALFPFAPFLYSSQHAYSEHCLLYQLYLTFGAN